MNTETFDELRACFAALPIADRRARFVELEEQQRRIEAERAALITELDEAKVWDEGRHTRWRMLSVACDGCGRQLWCWCASQSRPPGETRSVAPTTRQPRR